MATKHPNKQDLHSPSQDSHSFRTSPNLASSSTAPSGDITQPLFILTIRVLPDSDLPELRVQSPAPVSAHDLLLALTRSVEVITENLFSQTEDPQK